jgi:hypothetical protein
MSIFSKLPALVVATLIRAMTMQQLCNLEILPVQGCHQWSHHTTTPCIYMLRMLANKVFCQVIESPK